jgi:hypothetical protein
MTGKKAMKDAETKSNAQGQDKSHASEIPNDVAQELQKMQDMELFNNPIDNEIDMEEE